MEYLIGFIVGVIVGGISIATIIDFVTLSNDWTDI